MTPFEWLYEIGRRSGLSREARSIAAVLFVHMMDAGETHCCPSLATIAKHGGYRNGRTVVPHLNELEHAGWLLRDRTAGEETCYFATSPVDWKYETGVPTEGQAG